MRFVSGGAGAGAIVIGLALTLAGCVGDPAPIVTRTPSGGPVVVESPDATPSPTPTALSNDELFAMMPEGADRDDLYGAMVTAQFFLEQYSVMFQTGDTRVWEALSDPGCAPCSEVRAAALDVHQRGASVDGGEITVEPATLRGEIQGNGSALVLFEAAFAEGTVIEADGSERTSGEARTLKYAFELAFSGQVWSISDVGTAEA
ncbi:DUF6318 family protein [Demequina sp. SYSU T00068]|uniref:DUF6318 family protein n=1 Tax=Demequina lignilytica TaxID=3051663 RepID=UPI002618D0BE|nr:DUF6318 family protein [Demequina sp. SYSU T00068]MDN4491181.1 DUF6318 family protein [Demequina sp. SYSU T00068]